LKQRIQGSDSIVLNHNQSISHPKLSIKGRILEKKKESKEIIEEPSVNNGNNASMQTSLYIDPNPTYLSRLEQSNITASHLIDNSAFEFSDEHLVPHINQRWNADVFSNSIRKEILKKPSRPLLKSELLKDLNERRVEFVRVV